MPSTLAEPLSTRYPEVRQATERLCEPLSPEDCAAQSMKDASPAKWHLAHTTWFFETFVLERLVPGYEPFDPDFRVLFNSYYNTVGEQHARPERGLLTRPSLERVLEYRAHVDERILNYLEWATDRDAQVILLGLHHEQQHQELILTDVKHLLSRNPTGPAYRDTPDPAPADPKSLGWHRYFEGLRSIGHEGEGFTFDNERPGHREFVEAFDLGSRLITNGEFLQFIEAGGYENPEPWLSDGWDRVRTEGWTAPLYWNRRNDGWFTRTLSGLKSIRPVDPVCHVSFYEADAFVRWYGARLPTESEWEVAASEAKVEGNFVESGLLHPTAAPGLSTAGAPQQLYGDVWEWTSSGYSAYPGYQTPEGAFGEYNSKFMSSQMVLRGGSCVTPLTHIRPTYRNFFHPDARWQFTGIRLARDSRG